MYTVVIQYNYNAMTTNYNPITTNDNPITTYYNAITTNDNQLQCNDNQLQSNNNQWQSYYNLLLEYQPLHGKHESWIPIMVSGGILPIHQIEAFLKSFLTSRAYIECK